MRGFFDSAKRRPALGQPDRRRPRGDIHQAPQRPCREQTSEADREAVGEGDREVSGSFGLDGVAELCRNGGRHRYRPSLADEAAWDRAARPKPCKLALKPALREHVVIGLRLQWSPE